MRMARVLVGDPGGAQAEMRLPYDSRWDGRVLGALVCVPPSGWCGKGVA